MPFKTVEQRRAYAKAWKAANPNYQKSWFEANPTYKREYYRENREKLLSYTKAYAKRNPLRLEREAFLESIKAKPCVDCGKTFPPECMDFDHVRGVKVKNVSLLARSRSGKELLDEIAKCDLVCACCHRTRTRKRALKSTM